MKRLLLLPALLSLLACSDLIGGADPSGPPGAGSDAITAAKPAEKSGSSAYLAWSIDEKGQARTAWLDAQGQERAARDAVVLAWEGQIWTMQAYESRIEALDCECVQGKDNPYASGEPPADCQVMASVERAALVSADGKARREVIDDPEGKDPWFAAPQRNAAVLGAAGPYVFLKACSHEYSCGAAHGAEGCTFSVVDLRDLNAAPAILSAPERIEIVRAEGSGAAQALQEAAPDEGGAAAAPLTPGGAPEGPELTAYYPAWTPAGAMEMVYQFTIPACNACGDGAWGSYTRSSPQRSTRVPAALAAYNQPAPAPVRAWWAAHPGAAYGWSPLADGTQLAAFQGK